MQKHNKPRRVAQRAVSPNWPKIKSGRPMVTAHLPWKFHANRSSRFLVILLTKKQFKTTKQRNRSKTVPRPRCIGGGVKIKKKNEKRQPVQVHGNAKIPMQITAILVPQDKFLALYCPILLLLLLALIIWKAGTYRPQQPPIHEPGLPWNSFSGFAICSVVEYAERFKRLLKVRLFH